MYIRQLTGRTCRLCMCGLDVGGIITCLVVCLLSQWGIWSLLGEGGLCV